MDLKDENSVAATYYVNSLVEDLCLLLVTGQSCLPIISRNYLQLLVGGRSIQVIINRFQKVPPLDTKRTTSFDIATWAKKKEKKI